MPQIAIRRVIEERFDVDDETARDLLRFNLNDKDALWDWFYANESGLHEVDSITAKKVPGK